MSLVLIDKRGLDALSMREVARRLKVTHAAPYHHFKDRSAIVAALVAEGLDALTARLEAAAAAHDDPKEAFEACGRAYVNFALTKPAYFRLMFRPELTGTENRAEIDAGASRSFGVLASVVARCHAKGVCTALDADALALTGWATAHGLASLCLDGPLAAKDDPRAIAELVGATMGALLAHGPQRARVSAPAKPRRATRR